MAPHSTSAQAQRDLSARALTARSEHVDTVALEAALRRHLRGEVRFDAASRALYATDGSNYRQVPIGVVVPRDTEDVLATVALCREHRAPLLARGGGTSLAGQCCNVALTRERSASTAGQQRSAMFAAQGDRSNNVLSIAWDDYSDRNLAIVRTVGRIERAAGGVKTNFSTQMASQSGFKSRGVNGLRAGSQGAH